MNNTVAVPLPDGRWLVLPAEVFAEALQAGATFASRVSSAAHECAPEQLKDSRGMAALLGCNDTLVEQMAKDGRIPAVRIGRLLRFEPTAVLAALRTQKPCE